MLRRWCSIAVLARCVVLIVAAAVVPAAHAQKAPAAKPKAPSKASRTAPGKPAAKSTSKLLDLSYVTAEPVMAWVLHPRRVFQAEELQMLPLEVVQAAAMDANGKPMHSWRVLILPYIEQKALYDRYDFDEPWDGPNNSQLAALMPPLYACPSDATAPGSTTTAYVVINGNGALFDAEKPCPLASIHDGMSNTLLVVEAAGAQIHWMEPRDLDFSKMQCVVNGPGGNEISSHHPGTAIVAFADGSARALSSDLSSMVLRAMITRNGGEPITRGF